MATTYDKASLVMIPSGYKDDKLYSVKPTDGSGDFTFSRDGAGASPATRVNASGLIEKGRENILTYSNDFSNAAWVKILSSVTGGQSGYDGSSDAWLLNVTAGTGSQQITQTISASGLNTYSVYVKAGTTDWVALRATGTPVSCLVWFDLTNGVKGSNQNAINYSITSVGSGWYRCEFSTTTAINNVFIYPATADDLAGLNCVSGDNIYIQDAQLEQGLVATAPAIETTTAAVSAGLLGDMPRLDYSGGATCPSLLLEPSRVNLLPHSEYFGASDWEKREISITSNAEVSPEGVSNAAFVVPSTTNDIHRLKEVLSTQTGLYTQTIYAKQGGYKNLLVWDEVTNGGVGVNLDDLSIFRNDNNSGYNVEDAGNGWVRISVTHNYSAQTITPAFYIYDNSATPQITYAADGTSGVYIYGIQIESGSYPTSYIPTYGSASTRGADDCSKTGISSLIGQTEGTLFVDAKELFTSGTRTIVSVYASGSSYYQVYLNASNQVRVDVNGVLLFLGGSVLDNTQYKIAFAYKGGDNSLYINGVEISTSTSTTTPSSLTNLYLGNLLGGEQSGVYNQALLFKTRLTNAELAALTQI